MKYALNRAYLSHCGSLVLLGHIATEITVQLRAHVPQRVFDSSSECKTCLVLGCVFFNNYFKRSIGICSIGRLAERSCSLVQMQRLRAIGTFSIAIALEKSTLLIRRASLKLQMFH
jgi:hypothetical protein